MEKLTRERSELDAELRKILGEIGHSEPRKPRTGEPRKRRCNCVIGRATFIGRKKTAGGRDTVSDILGREACCGGIAYGACEDV
jgi:hypothetical protein